MKQACLELAIQPRSQPDQAFLTGGGFDKYQLKDSTTQ